MRFSEACRAFVARLQARVLRDERGISEMVAAIALVAIAAGVALVASPKARQWVTSLLDAAGQKIQSLMQ